MKFKTFKLEEILSNIIDPYAKKQINVKPGAGQSAKRYSHLRVKEPETLKWINDMSKDSILLDIGSNVGVFTLASIYKGIRGCIAIDPSIQNCVELYNLCTQNNITNVSIWCATLTKQQKISECKVDEAQLTTLERQVSKFNYKVDSYAGLGFIPQFLEKVDIKNQLSPPLNIDQIDNIKSVGISHIKIDTDGAELEILGTINNLLETDSLKSILFELRSEEDLFRVEDFFESYGFKVDQKYEPKNLKNHSSYRRTASNRKDRNYIFSSM